VEESIADQAKRTNPYLAPDINLTAWHIISGMYGRERIDIPIRFENSTTRGFTSHGFV
jgi:hypothetical protein